MGYVIYWVKVACHFQASVVLYQVLAIFTKYEMIHAWDAVSTLNLLPRIFLSTDLLLEKRTGLIAMPC